MVPAQRSGEHRDGERRSVDLYEALEFLELYYTETRPASSLEQRLHQVRDEIAETGTYRHTNAELTFGARVAWRNSARCIGRLYWQSLRVRDRRHVDTSERIADESFRHLRGTTRSGQIRSTLTVFAPDTPDRPGPRIHNEQLLRYAGYRSADGTVLGDPRYVDFTERVSSFGWQPPASPGRFDLLPLMITGADGHTQLFDVPGDAVLEVALSHPEFPWFAELGLRWHAVPAISNMPLVIGGIRYPAAPFNGWYLNTEIGARNLTDTDRYDLLPELAARMGLDTSSVRTMWRDRALVEMVRAVQHSFDTAGVKMADHHTESERFLDHVAREKAAGRTCPAEWSWIVPPMSGGLTTVFHQDYDQPNPHLRPAFLPPQL
ncbi:nitric oxide synthase oxygenase [Pseudonocardia spinosispora]|uniref:nitric oxide synthase oxygenase n=1 Tax=Pseudonocardia spinosispora TaxID=103441 RepID=UPI000A01C2FD|nr:nitric oxide synthase oxygenase [Pseudonocardia spinosispora]